MLRFSELQSSLVDLLLVVGGALVLSSLFNRRDTTHRVIMFSMAIVLSLRYILWRATETVPELNWSADSVFSWLFLTFEGAAMISSLSAFIILMRRRERSSEADMNADWWQPAPPPKVALLIATYNEERGVLIRTIAGAKAQSHGPTSVYVLDDGKRDWLRAFCFQQGVEYVRRPDNEGSKAGNINYTLGVLAASPQRPDFVGVLDADFVPHHNFVSRALALFHDPNLGLVQTPQHFFNADPIQHNLGLSRAYPDEQRFFFDHLQPSRDGWGIAFCCGTSSLTRWTALEDVGYLPTDSITEDFLLTLTLQEKGWHTVYLNEPLTEGLAPEGLKEYVTQRARWCLGLMQIVRGGLGPLARHQLRWRDRWSVADAMLYWITSFPFRIAALVFPLLYWFLGITVVNASVPDVLSYFATYFIWTLFVLNFVSGGLVVPIVNDVSQLLAAIPITRAAFTGLVKPKGHPFSVTAKGGDRTKVVIQWRMMAPFLVLFGMTLTGLLLGLVSDRFAFNQAGEGKSIVLFWTIYNLIILAVTIMVCIEAPRLEVHLKDRPQRALLRAADGLHRVWITDLTQETVRIRGLDLAVGDEVVLGLRRVGDVRAFVLERSGDGCRLSLDLDEEQHGALLRRLYGEGHAPGVTRTRMTAIVRELLSRLISH